MDSGGREFQRLVAAAVERRSKSVKHRTMVSTTAAAVQVPTLRLLYLRYRGTTQIWYGVDRR